MRKHFVLGNVDQLAGTSFGPLGIALPVGISFYTFVQIGFLVEVHNRQVHAVGLGHYALFACFFPCVTAGPILLQREMLPQFRTPQRPSLDPVRIAVALSLLVIGLGKKLLLADSIAPFADGVFDRVAAGAAVATGAAWIGAVAYTLLLYFDFSGYSDLALAAACLFGLRLPINFSSPLKATSISDFWRRWHITMTRFFTNYLYAPMALSATRLAMRGGLGPHPRFLLAAKNLAPHYVISVVLKASFGMVRAVPALIWALLFIVAVGLGPLPGILALAVNSIGMLGKVFAEAFEEVDKGIIEAIRATGGNWLQVVTHGIIPETVPTLVSWSIFRLDINVRYSSILGIVGAGGIGWELARASRMGDYASAMTVTLVIFAMVFTIELITDRLRKLVR